MALPSCHMFCQFYVSNMKRLSCLLYQKSCDFELVVPFNIASYAILTHMIAHVMGCSPSKFVHTMGDTHIYNDYIDTLKTQIKHEPNTFPHLEFRHEINNIDNFKSDDFNITGYKPYPQIKMKMSV